MPHPARHPYLAPSASDIPPEGLPVLVYEAGGRFAVLGTAHSVQGATRIVRKHLAIDSRMLLERHGFELHVFRRSALMRELNGGPDGFVWSIGAPGPASKRH